MKRLRQVGLAIVLASGASGVGTGAAADGARLSPQDQAVIMKVLCREGALERVGQTWFCKETAEEDDAPSTDVEWSFARQGRYVARDGEWLVSLAGECRGGCPGVTYVLERSGARWKSLASHPSLVSGGCAFVGGMADGFERVACLHAAGPHQGFMSEVLDVVTFAGGQPGEKRLLYAEQGGECWLAHPPQKAEHRADSLTQLAAGDRRSETALTIRLTVQRLEGCDATIDDPDVLAKVKAEHVLRFLKRGADIVPDAETAGIIRKYGWEPSGH